MFIEFQVGNFRSFRDVQKFSMQAAPLRANDGGLEEDNVFEQQDLRLLKSKAIYGSNASGKSNFAKAVSAFVYMVSQSVTKEDIPKLIWEDRFSLITNWDDQTIYFQYIFLYQKTRYRYGFQILDGKVHSEWLFAMSEKKEEEYFLRNPDELKINSELFQGADHYVEQISSGNNEIFRKDSLFLTGAALNANKLATQLRNEIRQIITTDGLDDKMALQFSMGILETGTESQKLALKQLMNATDTDIADIEILDISESLLESKFPKNTQEKLRENSKKSQLLFSWHSRYNEYGQFVDKISVPFPDWESKGTAKLFGIGALLLEAFRLGRTMVIDEFDARLHPNLTLKIVDLFQSEETNPKHAQLIFVTHDSSLLKRANLRRDQICFVNKDKYGISTLRTLIEFKGVRKDASYEKEYLQGSYAGIPYLDKLDSVISQTLHDNGVSETK